MAYDEITIPHMAHIMCGGLACVQLQPTSDGRFSCAANLWSGHKLIPYLCSECSYAVVTLCAMLSVEGFRELRSHVQADHLLTVVRQDLCELFSGFGPIQAAKARSTTDHFLLIMRCRRIRQVMTDNRGRSFGFVNFEQSKDAKEWLSRFMLAWKGDASHSGQLTGEFRYSITKLPLILLKHS